MTPMEVRQLQVNMDYKERYATALERASKLRVQNPFDTVGQMVEHIFPELKESEDEKIRNGIIALLKFGLEDGSAIAPGLNVTKEQALTWLERQDEQEPYGQRKECEDCQFNYAGECKGYCVLKRNEQKPDVEVEPKFKVGDIVQYITDSTDRRKIEEIDTLCNMYHTDSSPIMFEIEDEWKVVVNAEDVEQESVDKVDFEKKELKKIESKTPDPDKVIEWLNDQACLGWIEDVEVDKFIAQFKKDFGL